MERGKPGFISRFWSFQHLVISRFTSSRPRAIPGPHVYRPAWRGIRVTKTNCSRHSAELLITTALPPVPASNLSPKPPRVSEEGHPAQKPDNSFLRSSQGRRNARGVQFDEKR